MGNGLGRRQSSRKPSLSYAGTCSRRTSVTFDSTSGHHETEESPIAPGLSQSQFFEWLTEIAAGCLTLARSVNQAFPLCCKVGIGSGVVSEVRGSQLKKINAAGGGVAANWHNAARVVALLQWMEVSRGMRKGGIPAFRLSSCFAKGTPPLST